MGHVIRVGITGCGSVTDKYSPQLHSLNYPQPRANIVETCDLRPELGHKLWKIFDIEAFTTDEHEIVDASVEVAPALSAGGQLVHDAGPTT